MQWLFPQQPKRRRRHVAGSNTTSSSRRSRELEPSADLWDLVLDMNWQRVIDHAREHPHDAEWQDGHWHETPLYLACQHNPPQEVIHAIRDAYPQAVLIPTRANHDLPLHIACRYQLSKEVLEALVQDFPVTAVEQTRWGRTPIMALWEFRPKDRPLDEEFWKKIEVLLLAVARFREDPRYLNQEPATRTKSFRKPLGHESPSPWTKNRDDCLMVHAAVSLGTLSCPAEVLEHVLTKWPGQVQIQDTWGQLPLHIVVGPTTWSPTTRRKYKPREQKFLSLLLQAYPHAAQERSCTNENHDHDHHHHHRYPLHSALANRHTWEGGVQDLFHAAPHVLTIPDPFTRLYPFQLAAIPVGDTIVDLDTIYHLLRAQPDVLRLFDCSFSISAENRMQGRSVLPCPNILHETLIGTLSAIMIGGLAGLFFWE